MKNDYEMMTVDALNKLMTLARKMGWGTIVVGQKQYREGKDITYFGAPPYFNMWETFLPQNNFKLEIVRGDFLGIKP